MTHGTEEVRGGSHGRDLIGDRFVLRIREGKRQES